MSSKEHSMPVALELPETFGSNDLAGNFPEVNQVKETEGSLDFKVNLDDFDERIFEKHHKAGFIDAYDTRGRPRGKCLIINNKIFEKHDDRIGTDIDCQNLNDLFNQLGYNVNILNDQNAQQMKSECKNFILDPQHENYNSCVLIILSHGTIGKILGCDGNAIDENLDILQHFNHPDCKLTGKPKLVLVQACRLQLQQKAQETQTGTQSSMEVTDGLVEGDYQFDLVERMFQLNYKDSAFVENRITPDFADLLIAHSTLPGYVSWRNTKHGSWFVQAIVQIFSRNFQDEHVADMLVQVNQLVCLVFGQNKKCQMPCPINQLRKKFYFFPARA